MHNDLISVIIPCYNQAHFLGEAIKSVLNQTYKIYEIIVIDDGSNDNSSVVASTYPNVKVIRSKNQGVAEARNKGLGVSKGKYVVFLDADDRLLPEALEINLKFLKKHPESAFSTGSIRYIDSYGNPMPTPNQLCFAKDHYKEMLRLCFIGGCPGRILFRRDIFDFIGGFNSYTSPAEDYDMYLRVTRSFPIYCHETVVTEYRQHESNASLKFGKMLRATMVTLKSQKKYIKGKPEYESAYKEGINFFKYDCGFNLACATHLDIRKCQWQNVPQNIKTLLRYYPQGVIISFLPRVYYLFYNALDKWREVLRYWKRFLMGKSIGKIKARPKVITTKNLLGTDKTTRISWVSKKTTRVEVRVEFLDGPLFSRSGSEGSSLTGNWIKNGMLFFLLDVSEGTSPSPQKILSTARVFIQPGDVNKIKKRKRAY